jgi:hypothetical protein
MIIYAILMVCILKIFFKFFLERICECGKLQNITSPLNEVGPNTPYVSFKVIGDLDMNELYMHSVTLLDYGSKKEPKKAVRLDIAADDNELAATLPVNIFEDSNSSIFARLCKKFDLTEEGELKVLDKPFRLKGEVVDAQVRPHYIEINGERVKDDKGNDRISDRLKFVRVDTFLQTNESIIRSFERSWMKAGLIVDVEE